MFGENVKVATLLSKVNHLVEEAQKTAKIHSEELEKINQNHKDETDRIGNKHKDELERVINTRDLEVQKATKRLEKENSELRVSKETLENKVQMYEKAFENLGFDVKDMKEILNKLVDGVVAKGTVQVIK